MKPGLGCHRLTSLSCVLHLLISSLLYPVGLSAESPKRENRPVLEDLRIAPSGDIALNEQSQPDVAASISGGSIIVWVDDREDAKGDIYGQRYSWEGKHQGWNFRVNDDTSSAEQRSPAVAIGPDNTIWICWEDRRNGHSDVYMQRIDRDGNRVSSNVRVNENIGWDFQESPDIAIDGDGNAVIVWRDNREGLYVTYARKYHGDGTTMGDSFRVRDVGTNDYPPSVACHDSGSFVVAWSGKRNSGYEVLAQIFHEDTTPMGSTFTVRPDERINCEPKVANVGNGFIVVWEDHRKYTSDMGQPGPSEIYGQVFLWAGTPRGTQFCISGDTSPSVTHVDPKVIGTGNGDFQVCWEAREETKSQIRYRKYENNGDDFSDIAVLHGDAHGSFHAALSSDDEGNIFWIWTGKWQDNRNVYQIHQLGPEHLTGFPVKVNDDGETLMPLRPTMFIHANETFTTIWSSRERDSHGDLFGQSVALSGGYYGNSLTISEDQKGSQQRNPSAANGPETGVLVWEDDRLGPSQIYGKWFDPLGLSVTPDLQISNNTEANCSWPSAIILPGGGTVIVWQEKRGKRCWTTYSFRDSQGGEIIPPFTVHESDLNQMHPSVLSVAGGCLLLWSEMVDGGMQQIIGQKLDRGIPIGPLYSISDPVEGIADFPQGATTSMGSTLIVWEESLSNPEARNIKGRWISSAGEFEYDIFDVNDDVFGGLHYSPDIAAEGGNLVVVWCDERERAGAPSIYAQRFRSDGQIHGGNFRVNRAGANPAYAPHVTMSQELIHTVWAETPDGHHGEVWVNVLDSSLEYPTGFDVHLEQNIPNPFNSKTKVVFRLTGSASVQLVVLNLMGQKVRTLVNGQLSAGSHRYIWDGMNDFGRLLGSGLYFLSLEMEGKIVETKKMMLVR